MYDLISRKAAIAAANEECFEFRGIFARIEEKLKALPSALTRKFVELVVKYPDPELCAYKEYKGKPYYSIKYIENGKMYVGYGTYKPEVLSQYLKEYFMSSAWPEIIRCKDCKHFEYNHQYIIQGIPVLGHEVCNAWGDGCKTDENGYCFLAERRTDSDGRD